MLKYQPDVQEAPEIICMPISRLQSRLKVRISLILRGKASGDESEASVSEAI